MLLRVEQGITPTTDNGGQPPETLMIDGIGRLQPLIHPRAGSLRNGESSQEVYDALGTITELHRTLGIADRIPNPVEVFDREDHPLYLVLRDTIAAVAMSTYDLQNRTALFRTWAEATSSGTGRYYPAEWIANRDGLHIIDSKRTRVMAGRSGREQVDGLVNELKAQQPLRRAAALGGEFATRLTTGARKAIKG